MKEIDKEINKVISELNFHRELSKDAKNSTSYKAYGEGIASQLDVVIEQVEKLRLKNLTIPVLISLLESDLEYQYWQRAALITAKKRYDNHSGRAYSLRLAIRLLKELL